MSRGERKVMYVENKHLWVWGIGTYPSGSVLEGRARRRRIQSYQLSEYRDLEAAMGAALTDFPESELVRSNPHVANVIEAPVSKMPPSDFDPADAGEQWSDPDGDFMDDEGSDLDDFMDGGEW